MWKLSVSKDSGKLEIEPMESLPAGHELDWPIWRSLNKLKVGVGRFKYNLKKLGTYYFKTTLQGVYKCGVEQDMEHLLNCQSCPSSCSKEDLLLASAIEVARFWSRVI